ncbi:MAG: hypothetical protein LBT16_12715 [Treponema sp.]|nr:hypothetical protein [Treponema sp.]
MHDNNAPGGWKNLDDFRSGLMTNLQPATKLLEGTTKSFSFDEEGGIGEDLRPCKFAVSFNIEPGETSCIIDGKKQPCGITVFQINNDIFFLGCRMLDPVNEDFSVFFNFKTYRALGVHAVAREKPVSGECRAVQTYYVGKLGGAQASGFKPERTRDLIGQRLLIIYSPNHYYEQIFLNSGRYCWHNLRGEQYGDAASETCDFFKFDYKVYVYSWREMLIPCGASYILNYGNNTATGKFIGWTGTGEISHSYAGGEIRILSTTYYPKTCQPK